MNTLLLLSRTTASSGAVAGAAELLEVLDRKGYNIRRETMNAGLAEFLEDNPTAAGVLLDWNNRADGDYGYCEYCH